MVLSILTFLSGLSISAVAIYYSVLGLASIFSAAKIPVIIMGAVLELSKLVAAWWLKANWHRAPLALKSYLLIGVLGLMMITSMGIFGFLSKAHNDQTLVSGSGIDQLALIDEKIKTERDNIETARKALAQMDAQVNERLSRSNDDRGAERAVQIRRQQAKERAQLQKEITVAQQAIAKLNEERAPLAANVREIEAEVGPIKYITAFIYGDTADKNLLEKAVVWVIILIVLVFDPLAVLLLLSSQLSFIWWRESKNKPETENLEAQAAEPVIEYMDREVIKEVPVEVIKEVPVEVVVEKEVPVEVVVEREVIKEVPVEVVKEVPVEVVVEREVIKEVPVEVVVEKEVIKEVPVHVDVSHKSGASAILAEKQELLVKRDNKIKELESTISELQRALANSDIITPDHGKPVSASFGDKFPQDPGMGDLFVRTDYLPNRLYKWNGTKWIEVKKEQNETYLYNDKYIEHLVDKINKGEYHIDDLTESEQEEIRQYLESRK